MAQAHTSRRSCGPAVSSPRLASYRPWPFTPSRYCSHKRPSSLPRSCHVTQCAV